jgi:hypothetical protein
LRCRAAVADSNSPLPARLQATAWDVTDASGPSQLTARLGHAQPCCVAAGQAPTVQLFGQGLLQQVLKVHARQQGHFLRLPAAAARSGQALQVQLPRLEAAGLVRLELEQEVLVSNAALLLVAPSAGVAAELLELQQRLGPGSEVLSHVSVRSGAQARGALHRRGGLVWRPGVLLQPCAVEPAQAAG